MIGSLENKMEKNFKWYCENYEDTEACNESVIVDFTNGTNSNPKIKAHRDLIEKARIESNVNLGHGDRSLQYMWKILVDEMPNEFKFLEIGVYKGQILSLMELLTKEANKKSSIVGVTPLYDAAFAEYDRMPYIKYLYQANNLTMDNTIVHDGFSQNADIIKKVYEEGPYDMIYIDGDHSYEATVLDINNFDSCLKNGGFMIVDDASDFIKLPPHRFKGIVDVSRAVQDTLEKNNKYKNVLNCMHVRIFKKEEK